MIEKTCSKCNETKSVDGFYKDMNRKDGCRPYCKQCLSNQNESWRKSNREHLRNYRKGHRALINKKQQNESVVDYPYTELTVEYSQKDLQAEYNNYQKNKGKFDTVAGRNRIIWHYQKHFFEIERELWKKPEIRNKLIPNRIKYRFKPYEQLSNREILSGFKISGIHYGYSHFSPLWIKAFIERYNPSCIYDPCGGWGHRLIGVGDVPYIYNDIDERSCEGVRQIIKDFDIKNKIVYNNDSSSFTPDESYDCVFTCPPYFNVEDYTKENTSHRRYPNYLDWLHVWWGNTIKRSVKEGVTTFAFVVSHKFKADMSRICTKQGLTFKEEIPLGSQKVKSHFQTNAKKEILVVFSLIE